ncbi:MAG: phage/plasmid primase, P4 family [Thermodesulfovibrio sp.]
MSVYDGDSQRNINNFRKAADPEKEKEIIDEYFRLGWRVIPLREKGKEPVLPNWTNLNLTQDEFEKHWKYGMNVGIATGWLEEEKIGIVALDVDEPELLGFDPDAWIKKGAMAHSTSTTLRIVFYSDSHEVINFTRSMRVNLSELSEEDKKMVKKAVGKTNITLFEILGKGRQFMAPPSIHPKGIQLVWVVGPYSQQDSLIIHNMDQLKKMLIEGFTRDIWGVEGWFEHNRTITISENKFNETDKDAEKTDKKFYLYQDNKNMIEKVATEIMNRYKFITNRTTHEIYYWTNGFYRPDAESVIIEESKKILKSELTTHIVNEVMLHIRADTYKDFIEEPPHLIPLKNGVYDLKQDKLLPHSPNWLFFSIIPVEYNTEADCQAIKKFISDVTANKEDAELLVEFIGYCLYRDYCFHKSLMLVGDGANGKSTFLNLVKTFLGPENVAARSLQEIETNRFAVSDLRYKLANICADLPDAALHRTGIFKMLTGGDTIHTEKKFRNSFTFKNYAKLLFSANKLPYTEDDTNAFYRRWVIVVFPNTFEGGKRDPNILEKLTTSAELSGLLNWGLISLKRLLQRGDFSYSKTVDEIREDYLRKSSPVAAFVMDCLEVDIEGIIEKQELYNAFTKYCREKSLPTVSQQVFFRRLPQYIGVQDYRAKIGGRRERCVKGIKLITDSTKNESVSTFHWDLENDCQ